MTTTTRQTNLILNQDWTRIYQTFKSADFKSYDFENLRRVIITYLRENYPEDFNDYIESSEYLALIDAVAFLGQSLAFRIDLASRENFIELASRRESVLRIARMLSYNAKRNIASKGLLKFETVSTSENILDANGKNLARQTVIWNDPTNSNWREQFLTVINAALADNTEFGRSEGNATIQGVPTDQYRFRTAVVDIPIYAFNKNVAGRSMPFELVSTAFKAAEEIYEEAPVPGKQIGFVYKNDGKGASSVNTGFFLLFKQGSLELADFNIAVPTTNEKVSIDADGINNDDVWLFGLAPNGGQQDQWTKVSALVGNNIAYNSVENNIRNIYAVSTKNNDRINLIFADGVYGNLPQGPFRVYYRVSNGLSYSILPNEMRGINIDIPYVSKTGSRQVLSISMSLKYTVSNSVPPESIESIRSKAPAQYYTQNRMITAEDYNLAPLTSSQDILKVRAINRTSSGVSRNFDIIDASGKYSSVNVFADDGLVYKQQNEKTLAFKPLTRIDTLNFIRQSIEPVFTETSVYNFYITKFDKILFTDTNTLWTQITNDLNESTGYFINSIDLTLQRTGTYTSNTLKYIQAGAMIKFIPPAGKSFKRGTIVTTDALDLDQTDRLWTKIIRVVGDGTNAGRGTLSTGRGPIVFNDVVPTGAVASRIIPKFVNNLPDSLETQIINLCAESKNFGLRFDLNTATWKIITAPNIDLINAFALGKAGDISNNNLDTSWILAFTKEGDEYKIRVRILEYVFGSLKQNRFYFDVNQKIYDGRTGKVVKDQVRILGINAMPNQPFPLKQTLTFEVDDSIKYEDGYQSAEEIKIAFSDSDDDGVIDNPDTFEQVVGSDLDLNYIFFIENVDSFGNIVYTYVPNPVKVDGFDTIEVAESESAISLNEYVDGQLIYFYDSAEDRVKRVDYVSNTLILEPAYRANIGRADIKFQYVHNANVDRRIDPSVSNIVDVYLLTRSYDTEFRKFLSGATPVMPTAPNSDSLRISFGTSLNEIKSISDEVIYHPVNYKVLFGATADVALQAQFKVVKNPNKTINDNDLKVRIISAINQFFDVANWDFGDRFYLGELITYITNEVTPDLSNLVIVPRQSSQSFGSLFEIQSGNDEILVSGATVDDIVIVTAITANEIRVNANSIVSDTTQYSNTSLLTSGSSSSGSSSSSGTSVDGGLATSTGGSSSSGGSSGGGSSGGGYY